MMWKVRRTVASSMHQLAVILGPEITSKDLLPVFSRFIKDVDEVRIGILQHLSEFLKVSILFNCNAEIVTCGGGGSPSNLQFLWVVSNNINK